MDKSRGPTNVSGFSSIILTMSLDLVPESVTEGTWDLTWQVLNCVLAESPTPDCILVLYSLCLENNEDEKLSVKVVNKDVVLFRAIDQEKMYSESAIIDRKSGELLRITRTLFYCSQHFSI